MQRAKVQGKGAARKIEPAANYGPNVTRHMVARCQWIIRQGTVFQRGKVESRIWQRSKVGLTSNLCGMITRVQYHEPLMCTFSGTLLYGNNSCWTHLLGQLEFYFSHLTYGQLRLKHMLKGKSWVCIALKSSNYGFFPMFPP